MAPAYKKTYPAGTRVRICDLASLTEVQRSWKFHHALQPSMLKCAGQVAIVEKVHWFSPCRLLSGARIS